MEELLTKEQYEDEFSVLYKCGLRIVKTQIENSREIMEISNEGRNVYHSIYSRIKEYDSVIKKCEHKGISPTAENIRDNIRDVAGIRVIALLLDDVHKIRDEIIKIPGLIITDEKDYIEHPKQNGYRSLHLIASVPVPYMGKTMPATVEIQIRTIAQELWSQVEHYLCYKNDNGKLARSEEMFDKLSPILWNFDQEANKIAKSNCSDPCENMPPH